MFGTFLHKNFEIDNLNCSILIPAGIHVDQYEKLGSLIMEHCLEIRKKAEEEEKEKQCCEKLCSQCVEEQTKESVCQ